MIEQQRVQAILQIRLDGAETWDVLSYIAERHQGQGSPWEGEPLTTEQVTAIIAAADDLIAAASPGDAPEVARHKGKLRNLYARAIQAGDVRTARSILNDLGKLDGITSRRKPSEASKNLRSKLTKGK